MPTSNKALLFGLIFIAVALAGFAAYLWIALHWSYSEGERAGFMQKLSHKGWLCKTWEGELSLVALPGAAPEKFYFSVRDEAIAQQINAAVGQRTALTYEQHKGLPTSCFGETEYFVTAVKVVK
ncbi:hypothetical protein [Gallionella capsiferriformans]|uniref:6-phosphogluconate dehydrogenase n=1 Tax=Gallionella capsiferriformans (strain ES-2) TaxID=395494 RepID=D9SE74_GALCS|nr:hypothetical protein [Gallionella capsiferriformans]ADL56896.1 hypothetical protein Galf_2904 [Gallionella capsiferriformans ES-2]